MHGSTSKMGAKTGGARYSFSLLIAHKALQRDLPATEQPWSLTGEEAENEPWEEFGLAKDNTSAWQGRAATQRLYYCPEIHNFIFMIYNCQLGLCSRTGCLGWVQKIWTAHENVFLFKLKSLAAFTCISTDWCRSHRESSWAKKTLAQTDDARLRSKAKKKINRPKPNPWFSVLILIAKVFPGQFFSTRARHGTYTFHNAATGLFRVVASYF